jgi:beta-N-acetylhexosaminidase
MTRWRLIGLAGCLVVVVGVIVLALGGGSDGHAVPEGGSGFHDTGVAPHGRKHVGLMDAMAPVLEPATGSPRATTAAGAPAPGKLPVSEARAAARLFLVGFGGTRPTRGLLQRMVLHEWGGIVLQRGNATSQQQVASLVHTIHGVALQAHHPAPLVVADMPGGDADAVPVGAPFASEIGSAREAQRVATATAKILRPLGIQMVFGPPADLGVAGGPWEGRAFSDEVGPVSTLANAAVEGYKAGRLAAAPGHFPGEGSASGDPSTAPPATVGESLADLQRTDLTPFRALAVHAPAIQLSSATYVAFDGVTPATLLPEVVKLLRGELGFQGVIVSGDLVGASLATGRPVADLAVDALKAGCDLLWIPGDAADQDAAWRAVVRGLRTGDIPVARVADALTRISLLRARYGVR